MELKYTDNWEFCVSVANSYLSTSWREHFFATKEKAKEFAAAQRELNKAVLLVDRDSY